DESGESAPSCHTAAVVPPNAGSYTIRRSPCTTLFRSFDTSKTATLTVDKVTLTVTPADKEISYGQDDPAFTSVLTGFVNGETASANDHTSGEPAPSCHTAAAGPHNAGSYTISCSGGSD